MQRLYVPFACLVLFVFCASMFGQGARTPRSHLTLKNAEPITHGVRAARVEAIQSGAATSLLPVWNFQAISTRDGNIYAGSMVGANPTLSGRGVNVSVTAQVVPIILRLHTIGVSFDPTTGVIQTVRGDTTMDPTVADNECLAAPNNRPVRLLQQSPILSNADFNFGGTDVGTTQATDAFQRANFWSLIDRDNYHVRLSPVRVLPALVIDVPANSGLALSGSIFGACSALGATSWGW